MINPSAEAPISNDDWRYKTIEIQDLFSPAAPINEASLIAGRQSQISTLTQTIFEKGRHAVLYGERGVGKTSLANTFHMMFAGKMRSIVSIRKPAFPEDTYSSIWKRVFSEIQVDGRRVSEKYLDRIDPDDVVRELGGFSLNTLPIIILDEFDKFLDIPGKKLMSHTLKALSDDRTANVTVVLVGVAEDIQTLLEEHASISRNIVEIKMPRMDDSEMREIITQRYPRVGFSVDETAESNILQLARGLPEYVHYLGREAAINAAYRHQTDVNLHDVDYAIRRMVEGSDRTAEEAYNAAVLSNKKNNLYKQVVLACALAKTDDLGRFTPSDVLATLTVLLGRPIKIANFFPHIEAFCAPDRGCILEKKGVPKAYKYRFKEAKMQPYVIMKGVSEGLIKHDLLVDPLR